jgi:hypothetical protein
MYFLLPLQKSDADLPVCSPNSVCNKIDTYGTPWVEKQCRCPTSGAGTKSGGGNSSGNKRSSMSQQCSVSTHNRDGHTIVDRTRQYKVRTANMVLVRLLTKGPSTRKNLGTNRCTIRCTI